MLRERIVAIAAHKLEASPDDIVLAGSRASVRGTPSVGMALAEVAALAYFDPFGLPEGVPAGLEASAGTYCCSSRPRPMVYRRIRFSSSSRQKAG